MLSVFVSYMNVGKCTLTCTINNLIMAVIIKCSICFEICYQRDVYLLSPRLCFFIVINFDLFVNREDSLMS